MKALLRVQVTINIRIQKVVIQMRRNIRTIMRLERRVREALMILREQEIPRMLHQWLLFI
jgi:hypothetical protein